MLDRCQWFRQKQYPEQHFVTRQINFYVLLQKTPSPSNDKTELTSELSCTLTYKQKNLYLRLRFAYDTDERNIDRITSLVFEVNFKEFNDVTQWLIVPFEFIMEYSIHSRATSRDVLIKDMRDYVRFRSKKNDAVLNASQIAIILDVVSYLGTISYYSASQFSDPSRSPIYLELEERPYKNNSSHEKFLNDLFQLYKSNEKLFNRYLSLVDRRGMGLIDSIEFREFEIPSSSFEVKSGGKLKSIEKNRQLIIPFIKIDESELSPNQLSEGTYKSLALVFYIITDTNPLLLIEEPEVCVHHGLLNSLISLIIEESRLKQILISTHSDFVLDRLKPDNIILVEKKKETGTSAQTLKKAFSKNDYAALKEYLATTGNLGEYWKEGGFANE